MPTLGPQSPATAPLAQRPPFPAPPLSSPSARPLFLVPFALRAVRRRAGRAAHRPCLLLPPWAVLTGRRQRQVPRPCCQVSGSGALGRNNKVTSQQPDILQPSASLHNKHNALHGGRGACATSAGAAGLQGLQGQERGLWGLQGQGLTSSKSTAGPEQQGAGNPKAAAPTLSAA